MATSSMKQKTASDFDNLVRNGIDFLEKAMSQLESDPKHSVINFYTAVEIFLKAPLVHEHWTLVVFDRDLNRQKYEAGDFLSVSFEDACTRLSTALSKPLKKARKMHLTRFGNTAIVWFIFTIAALTAGSATRLNLNKHRLGLS